MTDQGLPAGLPGDALPGAVILEALNKDENDRDVSYGAGAAVLEAPVAELTEEAGMPRFGADLESMGLKTHGIEAVFLLDLETSIYLESESHRLEPERTDEPGLESKPEGWIVDFARLSRPLVFQLDRGWLVASPQGMERPLLQLFDKPGKLPAPFHAETPLSSWISSGEGVDDAIRARLELHARGDAFAQACGLGASLRWKIISPPIGASGPTESQRALLAREIAWARGLAADDLARLEDEAVAAADHLSAELVLTLAAGAASLELFESADWRFELCEWLLQRDELQGLLKMLLLAGAGDELSTALADLDSVASLELLALPSFEIDNELLRRAALVAGDSWWTRPAELHGSSGEG